MNDIPLMDMHTHTDNSQDGHHSAMYMAEKAEEKGVCSIAFTDHCEVDYYYSRGFARRTVQSFFEISKARLAFAGRLEILRGIELAQPHYEPELAARILAAQPYDVVIGSIHNLRGREDFYDWTKEDFEAEPYEQTMNTYFDEIIAMIEWGNIDVVAHITYPFRYLYNVYGIREETARYREKVDALLELCAKKDKALEINMGGLKYPINAPSPDAATVKRFHELGGKLISVGSDSHYGERIGNGIPRAYEMAREAGFTSVVKFVNRRPVEVPIV